MDGERLWAMNMCRARHWKTKFFTASLLSRQEKKIKEKKIIVSQPVLGRALAFMALIHQRSQRRL